MRRLRLTAVTAFLLAPGLAGAASLDVTSAYKMKAISYTNLTLGAGANDNHSYLANDARLGIAVKKIALDSVQDETMDVGLALRALGVAGSTVALGSPVSQPGLYYPSTSLTPFIENAYVRVNRIWGYPVDATFGRQNYRLGSGLLLDDDGAGFTGAVLRGDLPWWGMKAEGFVFQDKNPLTQGSSGDLSLFGFSLDLPTEGTWQINQLFERDQSPQLVYGCTYAGDPDLGGCAASRAFRSFTSARYQLAFGPMVFDGEAALERGNATPTTPFADPTKPSAPGHILYNGNAQVVKMKWKQSLYKTGEGIARISLARGTGDDPGTQTRDEAFFPSHGHRFDGLERSGFGEFYGATPYDAYGGNYSTSTRSGLPNGASGIVAVGAGYTPPAWHGFNLDLDYFLYQAERIQSGTRNLGMEWDFHLRYPIRDQFRLSVGAAYFKTGRATSFDKSIARKYVFEASGRF